MSTQRYPEGAAREVALLQWVESHPVGDLWTADDARWATGLARAEAAQRPGTDLQRARARHAAKRLGERDEGLVQHLRDGRWSWRWPLRAALLGLLLGMGLERLGGPQMNLLALPLWGVLAVQLLGYAVFVVAALARWPVALPDGLWRRWWTRGTANRQRAVRLHWLAVSRPLQTARAGLVWHAALLGLSLGLVAGLYARGLQREYVIGWESTFLEAAQVQALADAVLAPASAFSGVAVPPVAALRHGATQSPTSPAGPWLHLLAVTVLLVALPRVALAASCALRAGHLARALPLPGGPRDLRLAVVDPDNRLAGGLFDRDGECLSSPEGDRLLLCRAPAAPPPERYDWLLDATALPHPALGWPNARAVLLLLQPVPRWQPAWRRLLHSWEAEHRARLQAAMALLAQTLSTLQALRIPLDRPDEAEAAVQRAVQPHLDAADDALRALHGLPPRESTPEAPAPSPPAGLPMAVHQPLPRATSAVLGSVMGGALVGLKADLATGGLTLGGGALTGALVGGLGAAGLSDWINRRRDRRSASVQLDAEALPALARALLARWLALLPHEPAPAAWASALGPTPTGSAATHPTTSPTANPNGGPDLPALEAWLTDAALRLVGCADDERSV